jgi:small subunit ribosomal protein S17
MSAKTEGFKRTLRGEVLSDSGEKSIVVRVERRFKHPIYSKFVTKSKKYHAHDEKNNAKKGDTVTIIESRPFSKLKKWELVSVN